jgi:hypothetical protein
VADRINLVLEQEMHVDCCYLDELEELEMEKVDLQLVVVVVVKQVAGCFVLGEERVKLIQRGVGI